MAQEIAAYFPVHKIILISSIKSEKEKPLNFKMAAPFGFHYLFTKKTTFATFRLWAKTFGYNTKELQDLFLEMVGRQSDYYLQWALMQLSKWQGVNSLHMPIHHIHGSHDKTFPYKLIKTPVTEVKDGTHMMVYSKAEEISQLIREQIQVF